MKGSIKSYTHSFFILSPEKDLSLAALGTQTYSIWILSMAKFTKLGETEWILNTSSVLWH
jgi:hypothetical protein